MGSKNRTWPPDRQPIRGNACEIPLLFQRQMIKGRPIQITFEIVIDGIERRIIAAMKSLEAQPFQILRASPARFRQIDPVYREMRVRSPLTCNSIPHPQSIIV
jgi:hypothetical protein